MQNKQSIQKMRTEIISIRPLPKESKVKGIIRIWCRKSCSAVFILNDKNNLKLTSVIKRGVFIILFLKK